MLTVKQVAIFETGGPVPVAELCWPSSHTPALEACLEEGGWALDGLAGGRRVVGGGNRNPIKPT